MNVASTFLRKYSNAKAVTSSETDNELFYSLCLVFFFPIIFHLCKACFSPCRLDRKLSKCQKVLKCQKVSMIQSKFLIQIGL